MNFEISYDSLKKYLFYLDPEKAHGLAEIFLKALPYVKIINGSMAAQNFVVNAALRQVYFGKTFENPVGLAAGFDKNAEVIEAMPALGFGFTEIGTMTPKPQPGNDKPRMFRYPEYKSVQNAMGFNNKGAEKISRNLANVYPFSIPVGANIGKNKTTSQDDAINDYAYLIDVFKDISDYLVVNISSPNTPNLRDLQNEDFIAELFAMAKEKTDKPIFLKIAPDMDVAVALSVCECAINNGAFGIIATNTTIDYSLIPDCQNFGGLSGEVLREKSQTFFARLARELFGKTMLISVGGISTADEAYTRIKLGANLVQAYSGMIFEGPSMVRKINEGLIELLQQDGYTHISQAIGADLR